jgi:NADPH:quinone reductase-like Zn-dependent oxidoreductase
MKAIVVHQYGGPEVLKWEEYPDPVPGPGGALVRVAATSVNPIDYKRRAGLTKDFYPMKFPGLIGVDIAGRRESGLELVDSTCYMHFSARAVGAGRGDIFLWNSSAAAVR